MFHFFQVTSVYMKVLNVKQIIQWFLNFPLERRYNSFFQTMRGNVENIICKINESFTVATVKKKKNKTHTLRGLHM